MELVTFEEILSALTSIEKEQLKNVIKILNEIKKSNISITLKQHFFVPITTFKLKGSGDEQNAYIHLLLREKYFILIQNVIETSNDLMIKFSFNSLQNFCACESNCNLCNKKENSQFLLNIMRYIQHTHINNQVIKLEIFKFLLNSYEVIEKLLNIKILNCLLEIAINDWENENKIIQSSSKALIIKYIAVVCNKINLYDSNSNENMPSKIEFDSFLVGIVSFLLRIFKEEQRSIELRLLALECIELLLNNFLIQSSTSKNYCIKKNEQFIEFAWQSFCPSILFQFGDCGLPSKELAPQEIQFKQIYTILIQLTGLIGGCKPMISVFEAIYQRLLFYPPEKDLSIILKLLKTYINEDFISSLCVCEEHEQDKRFNDFTIINLIIGFYRICYEKSTNDKMLQILSCECMCAFVQLIYDIFQINIIDSERISTQPELDLNETKNIRNRNEIEIGDVITKQIDFEAASFIEKLSFFLDSMFEQTNAAESQNSIHKENIDYQIKKFSLELKNSVQTNNNSAFQKFLKSSTNKIYATVNFSIYVIFKSIKNFNNSIQLSNFSFSAQKTHEDFFISRVLVYDDDTSDFENISELKEYFKIWLGNIYNRLISYTNQKSIKIKTFLENENNSYIIKQLSIILKQLDCFTKTKLTSIQKLEKRKSSSNQINKKGFKLVLIEKLLKTNWVYIIDVLIGFLLKTNLKNIEDLLFTEFNTPELIKSSVNLDMNNNVLTDISLISFAIKTSLEALFQIIKISSSINTLEKEMQQIYSLLQSNSFKDYFNLTNDKKDSSMSLNKISLNQLICLDFVLYSTSKLICQPNIDESNKNGESYLKHKNQSDLLWKYLIEATFFSLALQANMDHSTVDMNLNKEDNQFKSLNSFLHRKDKQFKSVYSNLNEFATSDSSTIANKKSILHSMSVDSTLSINDLTYSKLLSQQRNLTFQNLFFFLNQTNFNTIEIYSSSNELKILSKWLIMDFLADFINQELFCNQFESLDYYFSNLKHNKSGETINLDSLDFIWTICTYICQFSKRFLLEETNMYKQHEYFSFNNLIIDKLEEILFKLMNKILFNIQLNKESCHSNLNLSSLLLSYSADELNVPMPYSIFSVFINEIWLNIFVDYFLRIFSKCGLKKLKLKKESLTSSSKQNSINKSLSYIMNKTRLKSLNKLNNNNNTTKKAKKDRNVKSSHQKQDENGSSYFVIDLSICKKLICLIQKLFESYNSNNYNTTYFQSMKDANVKNEELVKTPSSCSSLSTPTILNDSNVIYNDFLEKLEASPNSNASRIDVLDTSIDNFSGKLLFNATKSIITKPISIKNCHVEAFLIDESFSFNNFLLIPYRRLMLNKRNDVYLKDSVISSICELIEGSSNKIKNSWNTIFYCLSKINLNKSNRKRKNTKNKSKKRKLNKVINYDYIQKEAVDSVKKLNRRESSLPSHRSVSSRHSSIGSTISSTRKSDGSSKSDLNLASPSLSLSSFSSSSIFESESSALKSLQVSTSSLSSSSSSNSISASLNFSFVSFRFDSYGIRLNMLVEIFSIFTSLASKSNYILTNGTFDFIKCVSSYLQYNNQIKLGSLDKIGFNIFETSFKNNENGTESEDSAQNKIEEDALSTNGCLFQEHHFQIISNYEHLQKLSSINHTNTSVKPFLIAIEKIFNILLKLNDEIIDVKSSQFFFKVPSFEIKRIQANSCISFNWLQENALEFYDLNESFIKQIFGSDQIEIEDDLEFKALDEDLRIYLEANDKDNKFKMYSYIIESLSCRIFIASDELCSVQIVELLCNILNKMISSKNFVLASYCLLHIVLQDLNNIIDIIEYKRSKKSQKNKIRYNSLINEKLYQNIFFVSNLICKILNKLIISTNMLVNLLKENADTENENLTKKLLNCIISRITYLIVKCIIRRLNRFDSLVELNFNINLERLYLSSFELNLNCLNSKCLKSIKIFHTLSLIPFNTLIRSYTKKEASNSDYSNYLEVLTNKFDSAWELYNLEKSFYLAKKLLYNDEISNRNEQSKTEHGSMDNKNKNEEALENFEEELRAELNDTEIVNSLSNQNEEQNFYRDFTLKFNADIKEKQKNESINNFKCFKEDNYEDISTRERAKQVNLTCFISMLKYHISLTAMIKNLVAEVKLNSLKASENDDYVFEFLKCLAETYLVSLKLDSFLSLKILLSKIFYLNYENSLANFINITKISFMNIVNIYFGYYQPKIDQIDLNYKDVLKSLDSLNEVNMFESNNAENVLKLIEANMESVFYSSDNNIEKINKYFIYFILHFTLYYFQLNEASHGFKLDKKYFNELFQNAELTDSKILNDENKNSSNSDDDSFEKKILNIFEFYKQHNKAFTMLDLTKKTKSNIRSMDSLEEKERGIENQNDNSENELRDFNYLQMDSRFRYQVWTIDLISHFLLNLNDNCFVDKEFKYYLFDSKFTDSEIKNLLINNLGKLIIILNSCSSYCQCSVNENNYSKNDLVKIRDTSIKVLLEIFIDQLKKQTV